MRFVALILIFICPHLFADESDSNWNLRTNPIAWIVGPHLRLDHRFGDDFTFGVRFNYLDRDILAVHMKGATVGFSGTYSFAGAFKNSYYTEVGVSNGSFAVSAEDVAGVRSTTHINNFGVQVLVGYHWFWDNFNLTLGLGLSTNSAAHKEIRDASGAKIDEVPLSRAALGTDTSIGISF